MHISLSFLPSRYRRVLMVLLVAVVVISACVALWRHQASRVRSFIGQALFEIPTVFQEEGIEVGYRHLKLSGFPFYFTVEIDAPWMRWNEKGEKREAHGMTPLIVRVGIIGQRVRFTLPHQILYKSGVGTKQSVARLIDYHEPATLTLITSQKRWHDWLFWWIDPPPRGVDAMRMAFSGFSYRDKGFAIVDDESKYLLARSEGIYLRMDNAVEEKDRTRHALFLEINDLDIDAWQAMEKRLPVGPMRVLLRADLIAAQHFTQADVPQADIVLQQFLLRTPGFEGELEGHVHVREDDVFPHGRLSLKLSDYKEYIEWATRMPPPSTLLFNLLQPTEGTRAGWEKFLAVMSGSKEDQESYPFALQFSREPRSDLMVDSKSLSEVVPLYTQYIKLSKNALPHKGVLPSVKREAAPDVQHEEQNEENYSPDMEGVQGE